MKKTCVQCGIEFDSSRDSAKFHSDSCRVAYSRNKNKGESSRVKIQVNEKKEEPEQKVQVSVKPDETKEVVQCMDCGGVFEDATWAEYVALNKKSYGVMLLCKNDLRKLQGNCEIAGGEVRTWGLREKWQEMVEAWRPGARSFWPSDNKNPQFMPNWVRNGHRTKREVLAHVLDTLQANRERILSHGLDGEITFTVGGESHTLRGKKEKTKKGTQTLEVKKPEVKVQKTELDWEKPGAIPVVCGVCKQLKEQTVYVKYTDVNGADSEPVFLCPGDFKRLQDHQRKAGGTITHLERKNGT